MSKVWLITGSGKSLSEKRQQRINNEVLTNAGDPIGGCMFRILTQDGPLCKKVCAVTIDLDKCFEGKSMKDLQKTLPSDMKTGTRLGAIVGSELHKLSRISRCRHGKWGHWSPERITS